jgi:hypothetical protein
MRWLYLALAVIGAAVPYSQFVPWWLEHGLNFPLMLTELFSTRMGAFFGLDVLIAAIALLAFIRREATRLKLPATWLPIAATCLIGVSCGLPLFLYLRERKLTAAG